MFVYRFCSEFNVHVKGCWRSNAVICRSSSGFGLAILGKGRMDSGVCVPLGQLYGAFRSIRAQDKDTRIRCSSSELGLRA